MLDDAEPVGRSLATAYEANPLVRWMFAEDLSENRLVGLFTALAALGVRDGVVHCSEQADGASIWFPPIPSDRAGVEVTENTAQWTSSRRGAALAVLAAARPEQPHYYLDAVGVVPEQRRRGVASGLLAPVLSACDRNRLPAYLENSDPANSAFYAMHGFVEVEPIPMPQGAPVIVGMWREPR